MGCTVFLMTLAVKRAPDEATVGVTAVPSLLTDHHSWVGSPRWFYTQT